MFPRYAPLCNGRLVYGLKHGKWEFYKKDKERYVRKRTVYYDFGRRHRVDGPAVITHLKTRDKEEWYLSDLRHREDGPATISGKTAKYYLWGRELKTAEELKTKPVYRINPYTSNQTVVIDDNEYSNNSKGLLDGKTGKSISDIVLSLLSITKIEEVLDIDTRYLMEEDLQKNDLWN